MKSKNAFETSVSSPTVLENGAPVMTGRGLEVVKRRIMESLGKIRLHKPTPAPSSPLEKMIYTEKLKFTSTRVPRNSLVALSSGRIGKTLGGDASEIVVPLESAEELIAQAWRRFR